MTRSVLKRVLAWARPSGAESRRFRHYHVVKLIHDGEKASVYLARSAEGQSLVAVKAYKAAYHRTARRLRKRYRLPTEGEIGRLFNPPTDDAGPAWPIVRTLGDGYEYDDPARGYYIVLEYVDGLTVKRLLGVEERLTAALRWKIAVTSARALSLIHERRMVHRDVCADNLLVARDDRVVLIDLGFAAPVGLSFREKSGTPSYMAPEQFLVRPLFPAADVYSLGVVLFELFTGRLPFTSSYPPGKPAVAMRRVSDLMTRHVRETPPRPSELAQDLPSGLEAIILKCLEKDPLRRYAHAGELMQALTAAASRADAL